MYLHPKPKKGRLTPEQNKHNEKMLNLAEAIRAKKLLEIKNGEFGFMDTEKGKGSFLKYFENLTEQRRGSQGNYGNWDSVLKHLKKFATFDVRFSDVDKKWLEDFKTYLKHKAKLSNGKALSINSQSSYYGKVSAALKEAIKNGIIQINPGVQVEGIKPDDASREFLTIEELQAAANAIYPQYCILFIARYLNNSQKACKLKHAKTHNYFSSDWNVRFTSRSAGSDSPFFSWRIQ